jgi:DNA-binding MarR family transcriptional regulator
MAMTEEQAEAQWELGKLVHDLDMQSNARMREWVAGLGLTVAQASALREMTGPMTMRELAGRMSCEPSNATVVIDKLETLRLIERRPHPTDRRAKQLVLTPEGAGLRERLLKVLTEEPLFASLTQDEQDALQDLLKRALSRAEILPA